MPVPRTLPARLIVAAALAALSACSGSGSGGYSTSPTGTTGAAANAVTVADNSFTPPATTVSAGTTVTWSWAGTRQHNVTFDDGAKSATQATGTYQRTFAAAGAYSYHCTIHGTAMSGVVTVK